METVTRKYTPLEERVTQAEELAAANGGVLPRFYVLSSIESAFAQTLLRNPEAFAHIPREPNINKKVTEHVAEAEKIAAANGGLLPSYTDLMQINRRLAGVVRDKRASFAHIPRAKTHNRQQLLDKRVAEAEALAAGNDGVLECTADFQKANNALVMHMRRHPEAFAHIPRKRRLTKTLEQHIADAVVLAEQNGGRLPASCVLRKDYAALDEAIRKNREAFAHIPRDGKTRTSRHKIHVYVEVAERIAREHGGVLPHAGLLRKLDNNLLSTIYRHPELFAHIPQEVRDGHGNLVSVRNQAVQAPATETDLDQWERTRIVHESLRGTYPSLPPFDEFIKMVKERRFGIAAQDPEPQVTLTPSPAFEELLTQVATTYQPEPDVKAWAEKLAEDVGDLND